MTKEEIIKYVTSSPENTNPNVLEGMLNELDNGGGSSDFSIAEVQVQIINTIVSSYLVPIIYENIIVPTSGHESGTFNVPICKNGSSVMLIDMSDDNEVATTGDIIYDFISHSCLISGNGTITISMVK